MFLILILERGRLYLSAKIRKRGKVVATLVYGYTNKLVISGKMDIWRITMLRSGKNRDVWQQ